MWEGELGEGKGRTWEEVWKTIITLVLKRHRIVVDKHPPYSPDLNPIEHVWVYLKRYLHKKYPDIADNPGGPDAVHARLAEVLPEAWEAIPESIFESWRSMPDRVAAVIVAKGWYTSLLATLSTFTSLPIFP